jgi:hypothetical protein
VPAASNVELMDNTPPGSACKGLDEAEDQAESLRQFRKRNPSALEEDEVKAFLQRWLESDGWQVDVKWGKTRGTDIDATKGRARWIIEAKGWAGGSPQQQGNYFLQAVCEILQRMSIADAKYSLALPDIPRYRGLWERFPNIAKRRMGISCLFVGEQGRVTESSVEHNEPC